MKLFYCFLFWEEVKKKKKKIVSSITENFTYFPLNEKSAFLCRILSLNEI